MPQGSLITISVWELMMRGGSSIWGTRGDTLSLRQWHLLSPNNWATYGPQWSILLTHTVSTETVMLDAKPGCSSLLISWMSARQRGHCANSRLRKGLKFSSVCLLAKMLGYNPLSRVASDDYFILSGMSNVERLTVKAKLKSVKSEILEVPRSTSKTVV